MLLASRIANAPLVSLALFMGAAACGGDGSLKTRSSKPSIAPAAFVDINPDPHIVKVVLVASESKTEYLPSTVAGSWAYRDGALAGSVGQVPGPLLEAHRGDRVRVHYRSELPAETTVHWHGLQLPNASD